MGATRAGPKRQTDMRTAPAGLFTKIGIATTVVDAAMAFARGNRRSGAILLGAAAVSTKLSGSGIVASIALRLLRRLR